MHIKRCMALAYLPTQFRSDGWLYILGECVVNNPKIASFNEYFEKNCLKTGAYIANTLCFYNVNNKTNNCVEAWNSRLNKKVPPKPNIAVLLKALIKDSQYYFSILKKWIHFTKDARKYIATKENRQYSKGANIPRNKYWTCYRKIKTIAFMI